MRLMKLMKLMRKHLPTKQRKRVTLEKFSTHVLNQVIKVNITSNGTNQTCVQPDKIQENRMSLL